MRAAFTRNFPYFNRIKWLLTSAHRIDGRLIGAPLAVQSMHLHCITSYGTSAELLAWGRCSAVAAPAGRRAPANRRGRLTTTPRAAGAAPPRPAINTTSTPLRGAPSLPSAVKYSGRAARLFRRCEGRVGGAGAGHLEGSLLVLRRSTLGGASVSARAQVPRAMP
ncbi:hypothetical protein EVAR_44152_1 [Eumeta japonica]|uniref:Uncharacterized protein n=1 Tax=Eumeta variegata TaxID=151549 RepID=A0A4C1XPB0_EUMVA|nr:hypothetical protein EVAR_44152_1 [Eumeta japonica]